MQCERCSNTDAPYECSMCGYQFCAGCVDLRDHQPRCWECLGIEPDEDEASEPDGSYAEYLHRAEIGRRMLDIPGYGHD